MAYHLGDYSREDFITQQWLHRDAMFILNAQIVTF